MDKAKKYFENELFYESKTRQIALGSCHIDNGNYDDDALEKNMNNHCGITKNKCYQFFFLSRCSYPNNIGLLKEALQIDGNIFGSNQAQVAIDLYSNIGRCN